MNNSIKSLNDNKTDPYISCSAMSSESPICSFYKDKGVFVTGGTGFFGKTIIEKLLRVTDVNQIYLLIRAKKGKDAFTRIDELFNDPIFDKVKTCNPKYRQQITIISGDCSLPNLGISPNEREMLKDNVNIVLHGAATVRFDEKIKLAIAININGTKEILKLCKEIVHLKAVVHISTAFANCNHKYIQEKYYQSSITGENASKLGDCLDEHTMNMLTPLITKGFPNTYTFTKALAENIVQNNAGRLPITIFRPGIVITTYKDPISGWIDNVYGPCGIIIGIGSGVLRICNGRLENKAHLVPVDLCVNALLASAWDIARITYDSTPIYNYVPDPDNLVTWKEYLEYGFKHAGDVPLTKSIWYPRFTAVSASWQYFILRLLYHVIPAMFIDLFMIIVGKKPRMLKIYRKVDKLCAVMEYFSRNDFTFENNNVRLLSSKLDPVDKELFSFDMRNLDWYELFRVSLIGLRLYIVKDDVSSLPQAMKRYERLKILHYTTLFVIYSLLFIVFMQLLKFIFF